jgi:VWFA-related protein
MFLQSLKHALAVLFLATLMALSCFAQTATSDSYPGVQIEFPEHGKLRIENELGEVTAEVWKEKSVYLTTDQGGSSSKRSSVTIENKGQGFVVRVIRRVGEPVAPINLSIKIPESAQVEIVTSAARISLRGVPSSATVKSVSGDIKVEFLGSADADLVARSTSGSVKSEIPQLLSESGHVLQARLGTGARPLRIDTETGNITLSVTDGSNVNGLTAATESRPPNLLGADEPKPAAGTPAPALDTQEIGEGDIIRVDSQLVTLNMSVVDRNTNRGLVGLTKSDFRLFENGTEQQILQFESSAAPFDLLLLIDLSGSTREKVALIRAAALRFINAARPFDRIGVVTFAGKPTVISPLTLDRQILRERVNAMETAIVGDTKLYDATDFAATMLLRETQNKRRTAIVLMSDGLDGSIEGVQGDGSILPYQELLNRVREFDGVLYTLWLNTRYVALNPKDTQPEAFDDGHDQMQEMADVGGGLFYEVQSLNDLAGAYERVVADLGTVYSLAYRPSDKTRDGKWRAIHVNVVRPSAVARGKHGYYAN